MTELRYPDLGESVYTGTLSNGLKVMVVQKSGFSRKLCYFATDFGSLHTHFTLEGKEYAAPAGVAHYLEHKLFDMPGGRDVSAEFAALGASVNAFTSYDMTAYHFSCTENFEKCLKLLLSFVSTPYFTEESVEKEQGIIGQEIAMNDDSPDTRVFESLMGAMYESHPIRIPILGTKETIAAITPAVLETSHRAFYAPGNMVLCVVGDVDATQVEAIALEVLGEEMKPVGEKCRPWEESMTVSRREVTHSMEVAMPMFNLAFKCAPIGSGFDSFRREIIGDLACEALFGESSELYLKLYEEGLIDSSFGGGFESVDGMAMILCSGDSDDPAAVRDAILAQAETIAREGIDEIRLERMKRSAYGRRVRDLDSFSSTCFRLCAYHFGKTDYFRFPEVYSSITTQDIRTFIAQVIRPERCGLSVINPIHQEENQ